MFSLKIITSVETITSYSVEIQCIKIEKNLIKENSEQQ